jgi:hypothetical protein
MSINKLEQNLEQNDDSMIHKETCSSQSSKFEPQNPPNSSTNSAVSGLLAKLDKLDSKNKIRIIFKDYHNYSEYLPYAGKYKEKFILYSEKKEFVLSDLTPNSAKKQTSSLKENLSRYLDQTKINDIIKKVLLDEIK